MVDSSGATLDFLLLATQDADAGKRFLAKALGRRNHPELRVIHTDGHSAYPPAVAQVKDEGALAQNYRRRLGLWSAGRTRAGYEAIHMIRKGQAVGSPPEGGSDLLRHFIIGMFGPEF